MGDPEVSLTSSASAKLRSAHGHSTASETAAETSVAAIVHDVLRQPGRPLNPEDRTFFEPRFGYDFSHVRVHADPGAALSASRLVARAWASGNESREMLGVTSKLR